MARTRTLAQLLVDVADRADMEAFSDSPATFVTKAQATRYLNQSFYALASRMVEQWGDDPFTKDGTLSTSVGVQSVSLPADCFKPLFFRVTINGQRNNIPRAEPEHVDLDATTVDWTQRWPRHRVQRDKVHFFPTPQAVHSVAIRYVSILLFYNTGGTLISDLSADTDYFDGRFAWEEWAMLDAARKCMAKEQRDVSDVYAEMDRLWQDILAAGPGMTSTEPERVRDLYQAPEEDDTEDWA